MKKVYPSHLHDWAIPKDLSDPVYVTCTRCTFSEVAEIMASTIKALRKFMGSYQLVLEFTEPETDPRFNVGYVGAVISVYAENETLVKQIREILYPPGP